MPEIVINYEGRAAITGLAYLQYLTPELRKWVDENCTTEPNLDMHFLPEPNSLICPKCKARVRPDYDFICLDEDCPLGGSNA